MKNSEIYRKAAARIKEYGWVRHQGESSQGRCCILGAMAHILPDEDFGHTIRSWTQIPERRLTELLEVVGENRDSLSGHSKPVTYVYRFNDRHCTRKWDAIAALEIAADLAECNERKRS